MPKLPKDDCIQKVMAAGLDRETAKTVIDDVARIAQEGEWKSVDGKIHWGSDALRQYAKTFSEEGERILQRRKLKEIFGAKAKAEFKKRLKAAMDSGANGTDALASLYAGNQKLFQGARRGISQESTAIYQKNLSILLRDINDRKLVADWMRGKHELDVIKELQALSGSKGRATDNASAHKIADAVHKAQNRLLNELEDYGAHVHRRDDYSIMQTYDTHKFRNGYKKVSLFGKSDKALARKHFDEQWLPHVDLERTYGSTDLNNPAIKAKVDKHFEQFWSGKFDRPLWDGDGGKNIAAELNQQRSIHYKSPEDFEAMNSKFGTGNTFEAVLRTMEGKSQSLATIKYMGHDPHKFHDWAINFIKKNGTEADKAKADGLSGRYLGWVKENVLGNTSIPVNTTLAQIGQTLRSMVNMSILGGVPLTSLGDIPNAAKVLLNNGVDWGESYARFLGNTTQSKETYQLFGEGLQYYANSIGSRFSAGDDMRSLTRSLENGFFNVIGITEMNNRTRGSVAYVLGLHLAKLADSGKVYGELPEGLQRLFKQYDISDKEWNLISKGVVDVEGKRVLLSDNVDMLTDEAIRSLLPNKQRTPANIRRTRANLKEKFDAYILDQVNEGVLTPNEADRAVLVGSTQTGTWEGEFTRTVGMLKSYPVAFERRIIKREIYGKGANSIAEIGFKSGEIQSLALYIAQMTLMGTVALYAKGLAKGEYREFRDVKDIAKFVGQGFMLSGGGMIYGDFLFSSTNRFGNSFTETLAGPAFGKFSEAFRTGRGLLTGDADGGDAFRVLKSNTPFNNVWYARAALDYLVIYHMQNLLSEASIERMEQRKAEQGVNFFIPPSEVVR